MQEFVFTYIAIQSYLLTFIQLSCAAAQGFALLEENSTITYLSKPLPPQDTPFTRFNDGGCDSKGRFFAGTIYNKDKEISGKLYRYDHSIGSCEVVDKGPFTVRHLLNFISLNQHSTYRIRMVSVGVLMKEYCKQFPVASLWC